MCLVNTCKKSILWLQNPAVLSLKQQVIWSQRKDILPHSVSSLGKTRLHTPPFKQLWRRRYRRYDFLLCLPSSQDRHVTYQRIQWEKVASDIHEKCPHLWNVLIGDTTTRSSEKSKTTRLRKNILPTLGTVVGMFGYVRNPRLMRVIQQLIRVQWWLGGLKRLAVASMLLASATE